MEKRPVLLFLLLALCASVTAQAHEIGTTRVAVSLDPDRTYRVEVVTDAASLVAKLLARPGPSLRRPSGPRIYRTDSADWMKCFDAN